MGKLGRRNEDPNHEDSFHAWMPEGHMLICVAPRMDLPVLLLPTSTTCWRKEQISRTQRRLLGGSMVMTVFPNLSLVCFPGMCSIRVWHPRSAGKTELWSWALYNKDAPDDVKSLIRRQSTQMFSPTGMLEQDDMEVWARLGNSLATMPPTLSSLLRVRRR